MRRLFHLPLCRVFPCTSHPLQGLWMLFRAAVSGWTVRSRDKVGLSFHRKVFVVCCQDGVLLQITSQAASETTQISPWEHGCASKLPSADLIVPAVGTSSLSSAGAMCCCVSYPKESVLPQCLASHLLCVLCYHTCLTAGKPGCRQAIPPSPGRKSRKIKDSTQHPDKHFKYFWLFLFCCWLLQLICLSWLTLLSLLQIWIWLEIPSSKHLGFCLARIRKDSWNSTSYACSKSWNLCQKCIDLSSSPANGWITFSSGLVTLRFAIHHCS